jgi:hypothetical protein
MAVGEASNSSTWEIVDAANGRITGSIQGGAGPHETIVGPDGKYVYLGASTLRTSISISPAGFRYDPAAFGSNPDHGISLSPDGRQLYLIDTPNGYVHVFDVGGLPRSAPAASQTSSSHPTAWATAGCNTAVTAAMSTSAFRETWSIRPTARSSRTWLPCAAAPSHRDRLAPRTPGRRHLTLRRRLSAQPLDRMPSCVSLT